MDKENIKKDIGFRLRIVSSYLQYTQEQMAEQLDLSERQYRRYESGESMISLDLANAVANLDDKGVVDISYIIFGRLFIDEAIEYGFRKMPEEKLDEMLEGVCLPDLVLKSHDNIRTITEICKKAYEYGNAHLFDKDVRDFPQFRFFTELFESKIFV